MPIFIARVVRNVQVLVRNAIQNDKNVTLDTAHIDTQIMCN